MNALDLSQAVFIQNQQIKTDSLKVADAFGKRHTHVLRAIESLDCPKEFSEPNFGLANYTDEQGKPRPMYEMTKDGWMFLVMGFTGEKAAQIKVAFINAFNAMATLLQNQQQLEQQGIQVGTTVRLNTGSPDFIVEELIHNTVGQLQSVQVVFWHKTKVHREVLNINTVQPVLKYKNVELDSFWNALTHYGIERLNHSKHIHIIALNLAQVCSELKGLPSRAELFDMLTRSQSPYPTYIKHNFAIHSKLLGKTVKCWMFSVPQALAIGGQA